MAEQIREEGDASRRQILVRVVVVACLVVGLLAGLLIYEQQQKSLEALPVPKPMGRAVSPIGNVTNSSPALPPEIDKALKEAPDVTQAALASMSEPVATPEVVTQDVSVSHEESPPQAAAASAPPARTKAQPVVAASAPARQLSRAGSDRVLIVEEPRSLERVPSPAPLPATRSAAAKPPSQPAAPPAKLVAPVSTAMPNPTGFVVQLGVFNNHGNAEQLRSKLALAGIPTMVETRVQLGPFKNREEALKAQETLKSLGLTPGLLVPPRKP